MKTLTYLPTLLALTIQVMVNGQTPGNQARKIRMDIMGANQINRIHDTNNTITISLAEYHQLLEQANYQKVQVKKQANTSSYLDQESLIKQIEASELSAKTSIQKFEQNREVILDLFNRTPKNNYTYTKAQTSNAEAEYMMKLAKEIREEANAQITLQARIGDMSNAEEKEVLAIKKQKEVLDIFQKKYPQLLHSQQSLVNQTGVNQDENTQIAGNDNTQINNESNSIQANDILVDLAKQIEDMKQTAQNLRASAESHTKVEKMAMINEAIIIEKEYLLKQIEVSDLKAQLNYERFNCNRIEIAMFIQNAKGNEEMVNKVKYLNSEAERLMKIGKEMREEANAQLYLAARYGEMSNAEEKEMLAINTQQQSIQVIQKIEPKMMVASN